MICKNCIHFDKCCADDIDFEFYALNTKEETKCQLFKDKSKFVELPYAVGDTIYTIMPSKMFNNRVVESKIKNIHLVVVTDKLTQYGDIYTPRDDDVYLTKEEAEARLKELESK